MKKMSDVTLDCLGKKCPMPVLMTKKELNKMSHGQVLELIVDDKGALKDVPALLGKTGDQLLDTKEEGQKITFTIKKA
jgi:tRNA 2-thiouridine synthesizing protein A